MLLLKFSAPSLAAGMTNCEVNHSKSCVKVAFLIIDGRLSSAQALANWNQALMHQFARAGGVPHHVWASPERRGAGKLESGPHASTCVHRWHS